MSGLYLGSPDFVHPQRPNRRLVFPGRDSSVLILKQISCANRVTITIGGEDLSGLIAVWLEARATYDSGARIALSGLEMRQETGNSRNE